VRTITAAQQVVLDSGVSAKHVRLWVKDAGGTWRDLTTYAGFNAVKSVSWKEAVNNPCATFSATLSRELYQLSFSPFMEDSALNREFDPNNDFEPLIAPTHEVKIEVAVVPMDTQPASGDWLEVFHGRIDEVNAASDENVTIDGRDMSGRLATPHGFIQRERVYAFTSDGGAVGARVWQPEMTVEAGEYVIPATRGVDENGVEDPGYNKFFKCDTSGITGTTEPVWTTGADQVDGTARFDYVGAPDTGGFPVEDIIQNILDDNFANPPTLNVPDSPLWDIRQFQQQREPALDGIVRLAAQIGWDLRQRWDTDRFKLTLYEPTRVDPDVDHTFSPPEYGKPQKLGVNVATIRNSWKVIIKDRTDLNPDGTPKRKEFVAEDAVSIARYGGPDGDPLYAEIQESETGNIDTETEAARELAAALSDCAEPTAELSVPIMGGFPWVELNDFYTFEADDLRFSTDQSLAVTSWDHVFEGGKLSTKLELRGKPTIGHMRHLDRIVHPDVSVRQRGHEQSHFGGATTPTATIDHIIAGGNIKVDFGMDDNRRDNLRVEYEVHVSTDPDFVPDATTLYTVSQGKDAAYTNQPGITYYTQSVPRFFNGEEIVRGQPTKKKSFVAGQASAQHLLSTVEWGALPLNNNFQHRFATTGAPDHWTWEHGITRRTGDGGVSGAVWLRFDNDPEPTLTSDAFPVERDTAYDVTWWAKLFDAGTGGAVQLAVRWLTDALATISDDVVDTAAFDDAELVDGQWHRRGQAMTAPSGARYARLVVSTAASGDMVLDIGGTRLERS
jgi:hypothetical protein